MTFRLNQKKTWLDRQVAVERLALTCRGKRIDFKGEEDDARNARIHRTLDERWNGTRNN